MTDAKPKRKFSFNLSSNKPAMKSEARSASIPKALNPALIYARDKYATEFSPPPSPFIDRQMLSPKTEAQLYAACASLVADHQGSSHDHDQPKLNFESLHRSMREKKGEGQQSQHSSHNQHQRTQSKETTLPFLYPLDTTAAPAKKYAYKPDTALEHLFPDPDSTHPYNQGSTGRRRDSSQFLPGASSSGQERSETSKTHNRHGSTDKHSKRQSVEKSAAGTAGSAGNSAHTTCSTPLTGSSEKQGNPMSTAPSSVTALSPLDESSKRHSRHLVQDDSTRSRADVAAAAWMREELEKRRKQSVDVQRVQAPASNLPPSRTISRKRSLREGIREYIRPSSSRVSRQASQESLRTNNTTKQVPARSGSFNGWRSWSLQRKPSGASGTSRPGSAKGHYDDDQAPQPAKPVVNLNRELPPLPSLDKWQENQVEEPTVEQQPQPQQQPQQQQQQEPQQQPEQQSSTHIAKMVRNDPRDQGKDSRRDIRGASPSNEAKRSRPVVNPAERERKKSHRRSSTAPDASEMKVAPSQTKENAHPTTGKNPQNQKAYRLPSLAFDSFGDSNFAGGGAGAGAGTALAERPQTTEPYPTNTVSRSPHPPRSSSQQAVRPANGLPKISIDTQNRPGTHDEAPNFSRKMSMDIPIREPYDPRVANIVEITGPDTRVEQKKGLKKFLGALGALGKKKSSHWMLEADGAKKSGISVDEGAGAPVVRY